MTDLTLIQIQRGEPDRKYRTLVLLQRSDRPRYWTFHCINCRLPVAELAGTDVRAVSDFYNPQDASNASVGVRCNSCKRVYFFVLQ